MNGTVGSPGARRWLVLSVPAPPRGEELLLLEALRSLGAGEVSRQGECYVALVPAPPNLEAFLLRAKSLLQASTSLDDPRIQWRWRSHDDWAAEWTAGLEPRRVGTRIVVAPVGRQPPAPERPDGVVIRLVPGTAFGTAEHATTRSCLALLEEAVTGGERVADVGAGSGILAIAAALLGACQVFALEMDAAACRLARENTVANAVADRVEVRQTKVRPGHLDRAGPFDGVLANLQADLLLPLLPDMGRCVAGDGWAILSGVTEPERPALLAAARAEGLEAAVELPEDGWWSVYLRKQE